MQKCSGCDVETVERGHLQWARILVSSNGKRATGLLHVMVRSSTYDVPLWWESPPRLLAISSKDD